MEDTTGSLMRRAALAACLVLGFAAGVAAQQPQVLAADAPATPEFLSHTEFHMTAAALALPSDDVRFSWDTHFGGHLDVVDYVAGRVSVAADYEAVLGSEYRSFDPNQGNYNLEVSASARAHGVEVAGMFHHESRHLSDRPKRFAIAWNVLGARLIAQRKMGAATLDVDLNGGKVVQDSYIDYTWMSELNMLVRRPVSDHVGVFVRGSGQIWGVNRSIAGRSAQQGGLAEVGVHVKGKAGAIELFAGFEKRVDADPVERQAYHWGMAGFRLLSR